MEFLGRTKYQCMRHQRRSVMLNFVCYVYSGLSKFAFLVHVRVRFVRHESSVGLYARASPVWLTVWLSFKMRVAMEMARFGFPFSAATSYSLGDGDELLRTCIVCPVAPQGEPHEECSSSVPGYVARFACVRGD